MKRYISITLVLLLGAWLIAGCGGGASITPASAVSPNTVRDSSASGEVIYVMNGPWQNVTPGLYTLTINDTAKTAYGTLIDPPKWYEKDVYSWIGHIAAPPEGDKVYIHGNGQGDSGSSNGWLGVYDPADGTLAGIYPDESQFPPPVSNGYPDGVTMAAFDNEGTLFVGNQQQDGGKGYLYIVNPLTGEYTSDAMPVYADSAKTSRIQLSGGDIAFDYLGNFFMITNYGKGLYKLTLDESGDFYVGEALWNNRDVEGVGTADFSGLAIRDNGAGDLVATMQHGDGLLVINKDTYAKTAYDWVEGYSHDQGDMSVGKLAAPCEPLVTALIAGQSINVGTVTVEPGDGELLVTYEITEPGWYMTATHTHVATDPDSIPQVNGNPIPGQFDYQTAWEFDQHVTEWTQHVAVPEGENWCEEDYLYIAAHAIVKKFLGYDYDGNPTYQTETAWGYGPEFKGKNWATYIEWEVCCNE